MKLPLWFSLLLLVSSTPLQAHSTSNSFLNLTVDGHSVHGLLRLRLQDVPWLVDVDSNDDLKMSWRELQQAQASLQQVIAEQLAVSADQQSCNLLMSSLKLESLNTGSYVAVPFEAQCGSSPQQLSLHYSLLMNTDAAHRGIVELQAGDQTYTGVFSPTESVLAFDLANAANTHGQLAFIKQGIWHIWTGYDHLLFLLALLLPLFLSRSPTLHWVQPEPRQVVRTVLWTVTAFTLAHSLTLLLATLLDLKLASAVVETLIAATVALSGLNVIYPIFSRNHSTIAFCFGLIHGLGFAGALRDLTLPTAQFVQSLLSFNLGVEAGQLALVALTFPLLLYLRNKLYYQRLLQPLMALGIFGIGIAWAIERGVAL